MLTKHFFFLSQQQLSHLALVFLLNTKKKKFKISRYLKEEGVCVIQPLVDQGVTRKEGNRRCYGKNVRDTSRAPLARSQQAQPREPRDTRGRVRQRVTRDAKNHSHNSDASPLLYASSIASVMLQLLDGRVVGVHSENFSFTHCFFRDARCCFQLRGQHSTLTFVNETLLQNSEWGVTRQGGGVVRRVWHASL